MGQLIKVEDQRAMILRAFTSNGQAIAKVVPRTMGDPNRLIRIAYNNVVNDPLLLACTETAEGIRSIIGGVMEALKLGLMIGGPSQEAFLIPFKDKGTPKATLIIGYQGFRNILDRSKSVIDVHPRAVYANDEFDVDFGTQRIHHKPWWRVGAKESGDLIAVYAIAHLQRGGVQIEVMPKSEIDAHRTRSRAGNSGPWVTDYDAMALKTVVRKIAKYLPKSSEILMRALDLDTKADLGAAQDFDVEALVIDAYPEPSKQVGSSKLEELKKKLPAAGKGEAGSPEPTTAQPSQPAPQATPPQPDAAPAPEQPPHPAEDMTQAHKDLDEALGADTPTDNAKLDAEIAHQDKAPELGRQSGMTAASDLFGGKPATVDQAKDRIAALARRAEELARRKR